MNVKDYGVKGDGQADDTAALRAALIKGQGETVYMPKGPYRITDTLGTMTPGTVFCGDGMKDNGANIILSGSFNKPAITTNVPCELRDFAITGNASVTDTAQDLIQVNQTNLFKSRRMFLNGGYNGIKYNGCCFYSLLDEIHFYNTKGSWLKTVGINGRGVQLVMTKCLGTSADRDQNYGLYFDALESLTMSDNVFSPTVASKALMHVETMSPYAGVQLISNSVLENHITGVPGLYLKGTAANPCRHFQFSNSYIAGEDSVLCDYGQSLIFSNTYFTSGANGIKASFRAMKDVHDAVFQACQFMGSNIGIGADGGVQHFSLSVTDCIYTGGYPAIYLANLSAAQIPYCNVSGGYLGMSSNPVYLGDEQNTKGYRPYGKI